MNNVALTDVIYPETNHRRFGMTYKVIKAFLLLACLVHAPLYARDLDDDIELDEGIDDSIKLKPNIQLARAR